MSETNMLTSESLDNPMNLPFVTASLNYQGQQTTFPTQYFHTYPTMPSLCETLRGLELVKCTVGEQLNYLHKLQSSAAYEAPLAPVKARGPKRDRRPRSNNKRTLRRYVEPPADVPRTVVNLCKKVEEVESNLNEVEFTEARASDNNNMSKITSPVHSVASSIVSPASSQSSDVQSINTCIHGMEMSHDECLFSPSHWSTQSHKPRVVIYNFCKRNIDSRKLCKDLAGSTDVAYGPESQQRIDFYGNLHLPSNAPVFAFVHGGYWQDGSRQLSTTMVKNLVDNGIVVAIVGYGLAQKYTMDDMVHQMCAALSFLNKYCIMRENEGLVLAGHSAGAHLVAMAIIKQQEPLPSLKGVALISGVYDLQPIKNTYIDRPFKDTLSDDVVYRNSPYLHLQQLANNLGNAFMFMLVGDDESPAFKHMTVETFNRLRAVARQDRTGLLVLPNIDHFQIVENLQDMNFKVTNLLINLSKCNILNQ